MSNQIKQYNYPCIVLVGAPGCKACKMSYEMIKAIFFKDKNFYFEIDKERKFTLIGYDRDGKPVIKLKTLPTVIYKDLQKITKILYSPNLFERFLNFSRFLIVSIKTRKFFKQVSFEEQEARRTICNDKCPYGPRNPSSGISDFCSDCGCYLPSKIPYEASECRVGNWSKEIIADTVRKFTCGRTFDSTNPCMGRMIYHKGLWQCNVCDSVSSKPYWRHRHSNSHPIKLADQLQK